MRELWEFKEKIAQNIKQAIEKARVSGKAQRLPLKIPKELKHYIYDEESFVSDIIEDKVVEKDYYYYHIELDDVHYFASGSEDFLIRFDPETLELTVKIPDDDELRNLVKEWLMRTFEDLYNADTDWSIWADWYIKWIVDNDFKLDTFESFVDYVYYDPKYLRSVWDFFYGWEDGKDFMESWVDDHEQVKFVEWLRENRDLDDEELEELEQVARKNLEEYQKSQRKEENTEPTLG